MCTFGEEKTLIIVLHLESISVLSTQRFIAFTALAAKYRLVKEDHIPMYGTQWIRTVRSSRDYHYPIRQTRGRFTLGHLLGVYYSIIIRIFLGQLKLNDLG